MKRIPLTRGMFALVDDEDYERVSAHKWCALPRRHTCYAVRKVQHNGRPFMQRMHRFILGLKPGDGKLVDHCNHNGVDNRRANMRVTDQSVNCQNRKGVRGYCKTACGYYATIYADGRAIYLGTWPDPRMARAAYLCGKQLFHNV